MSIMEDDGDAAPETVFNAGSEIYKPLLEASTGSTMIPLNEEEQVSTYYSQQHAPVSASTAALTRTQHFDPFSCC
jgi:hypothetical protein